MLFLQISQFFYMMKTYFFLKTNNYKIIYPNLNYIKIKIQIYLKI